MIEIEYKDHKISIPESWDDVTLAQWDQIYRIKPKDNRERVAYMARVCNVDPEQLRSWPAEIFNLMVKHTRFIFAANPYAASPEITIDGQRYVIAIEDDLTLGEWIDADEAQKSGERVLASVLSIVCRPAGEEYNYKNNDKRRDMFEAMPASKVLPLLGFFLQCREQLDRHTKTFSQLVALVDLLPPSTAIFRSLGVGTKLLRIWPIMRYLTLTALLQWRLRRLLTSCGISATKH